jgi:Leucine-rich repeat (LRR) protein
MLANIQLLDLSWCYLRGNSFPSFLRNMTSLVSLDLSSYDLIQPRNFENLLNIVPFASELHFSNCSLQNTHLSRIHVNTSKYSNIQYLDLSQNYIFGEFPPFLMNMSSLSSLDLSDNFLNSSVPVMSGLLTLKLSYNNYNHIRHIGLWKQCHLKLLRVDHNHIQREMIGPSTNISECSRYAMEVLDLSWNELNGSQLPESFGKFKALRELNLENSQLMGPIPTSIGKLTALKVLFLNDNQLTGPIPTSLGRLASLQKLSVSSNLLNGTITSSMGQLTKLIYLDVSNNSLEGAVSETHLAKLSKLKYFFASFNPKMSSNISRDWIPPFQLRKVRIDSCNISSEFPWWLRTQKKLRELVMSNSSISGYLPKWLRKMSIFQLLDLSHNQLSRPLTNLPTRKPLTGYEGSLFMKNNFFSGPIPESLCNWTHLEVLDLSKNRLSGKIPRCLENLINLKAMVFNSNELSGVIPNFIGNLSYSLTWLNLNNNSLRGELPISLENFYDLRVLDLGDNELSGSIPKWIGDHLCWKIIMSKP